MPTLRARGDGAWHAPSRIVTDAWLPQVNGVVRTLQRTVSKSSSALGHEVELIAPERFPTVPCPTYPEIRLAHGAAAARRAELLDASRPTRSTSRPKARSAWRRARYCLSRGLPFTTAYHTRFPEYVAARLHRAAGAGPIAWLRRFHAPVARRHGARPQSIARRARTRGASRNIAAWSRGVDTELFRPDATSRMLDLPRPILLYVGRVAVEKNIEAFLDARPAGHQGGGRRRPAAARR